MANAKFMRADASEREIIQAPSGSAKSVRFVYTQKEYPEVTLCDVGIIDKTAVDVYLLSGRAGGASEALKALFDGIGEALLVKSVLLRLYVTMDIHLTAKAFVEQIGVARESFVQRFGSIDEIMLHASTPERAKRYLDNMLEQCVAWRHAYSHGSAFTIEKAKAYIEEHYCDEAISLERVAAAVNVSPAYFSHLFKKETGIKLIGYITSLRMEKARRLLNASSKKIAEIASEVGYGDYHYFSCMFKKANGITPSEFRSKQERQVR